MTGGRRGRVARAALGAAAVLAAGGVLPACTRARAGTTAPPVRDVAITIHYSHFSVDSLTVRAGTLVRFVVRNDDPIDHELIVGDQAVQDRHEAGTEAKHGARPGEITVPAHSVAATEIVLAQPGIDQFACHLPGHYAYGMHGTITVTK